MSEPVDNAKNFDESMLQVNKRLAQATEWFESAMGELNNGDYCGASHDIAASIHELSEATSQLSRAVANLAAMKKG